MPERANFSATEYSYLRDRWGSKTTRITGESMRNFNQCALCLSDAVSPMTCREGHLFCKECILTNLLKQKDDIREYQMTLEQLAVEQERERERARERARERVLRDFERGQVGGQQEGTVGTKRKASASAPEDTDSDAAGPSTLASLPERARRVAQEAEDAALAAIEEEQRLSRQKKLPAFWLPSLTPGEKEGQVDLKVLKSAMEPRCRVTSEHGHAISIKSLSAVTFTRAPESSSSSKTPSSRPIICPGCKKALSNSHRLYTIRNCSHTFCNHCADELIYGPAKKALKEGKSTEVHGDDDAGKKSSKSKSKSTPALTCCPECSTGLIKNLEKDVIRLHREGTGFASAGGAEGKMKGIAFQG